MNGKITLTEDDLVKLFTLWVSEYHESNGLFDKSTYEKYKDLNYPEFAKMAFKHYLVKVQGE